MRDVIASYHLFLAPAPAPPDAARGFATSFAGIVPIDTVFSEPLAAVELAAFALDFDSSSFTAASYFCLDSSYTF